MGGFPEGMSPEERMKEHAEKMQKEQEKREKENSARFLPKNSMPFGKP